MSDLPPEKRIVAVHKAPIDGRTGASRISPPGAHEVAQYGTSTLAEASQNDSLARVPTGA